MRVEAQAIPRGGPRPTRAVTAQEGRTAPLTVSHPYPYWLLAVVSRNQRRQALQAGALRGVREESGDRCGQPGGRVPSAAGSRLSTKVVTSRRRLAQRPAERTSQSDREVPAAPSSAFVNHGVSALAVGKPLRGCRPPRRRRVTGDNCGYPATTRLFQEASDRGESGGVDGGSAWRQPNKQAADNARGEPTYQPCPNAWDEVATPQNRQATDASRQRQGVCHVPAGRSQLNVDLLAAGVEDRKRLC
jgi:hypothetical protein